jgi:hypothetical protein
MYEVAAVIAANVAGNIQQPTKIKPAGNPKTVVGGLFFCGVIFDVRRRRGFIGRVYR